MSSQVQTIGSLSFNQSEDFLGQGRFGSVFKGKYQNLREVAIRRVEKKVTSVDLKALFKVQGHPNIVNYPYTKDVGEFM